MRWFNTAGPCKPEHHYMLPSSQRVPALRAHVDRMDYVVLHAARQSGKTTALMALARELTAEGRFVAVLLSVEAGAWATGDPAAAQNDILGGWRSAALSRLPAEFQPPEWPPAAAGSRLGQAIASWCRALPRPLVLFLDEVDALQDEALVSVLRQLRAGYPDRPEGFPWSMTLIGLRDVRDYVVASGGSGRLGTASPFNIKVASITLQDFTRDEVAELYAQHTADTGQVFTPAAVDRAWHYSRGQPWLVNALAAQVVDVLVKDRGVPIDAAHFDTAKDRLVDRQDTHLDSLAERLREPRVCAVIEPILAGTSLGDVPRDDLRFLADLGLVRVTELGGVDLANPIYREVVARVLAETPRASLPQIAPTWLLPSGDIDIDALLGAFLAFWRRHGEALQGAAPYREVAAQLVMMAFLDRVANGGGRLDREYALGSGRIDLCLRWRQQVFAFELKTWRERQADPAPEGLLQLDRYLDALGLDTGWLLAFDQRPSRAPLGERTRAEAATTPAGRRVTVVRA